MLRLAAAALALSFCGWVSLATAGDAADTRMSTP